MNRAFPKIAMIEVTSSCNANCFYCYNDGNAGHLQSALCFDIIDRLVERGTKTVLLSGGEPMMHPDICAIAAHVLSRNVRLGMITNGILMRDNLIEWLQDGSAFVQVSLDSVNRHDFQLSRGVDCVENVKATIKRLRECSINCSIAITLSGAVAASLGETIEYCLAEGIESIHVGEMKPIHPNPCNRDDYRLESFFEILESLYRYHKDNYPSLCIDMIHDLIIRFLPGRPDNMKFCNAMCGNALQILYSGDICTCENMRDMSVFGNVYRDGLDVFDRSVGDQHLFTIEPKQLGDCRECEYLSVCRGGCRALTYHRTGDIYGRHPRCDDIRRLLGIIESDVNSGRLDNLLFRAELNAEYNDMAGFVKYI